NNDLFNIGTIAYILQMLKLPDGTMKVLVEGLQRASIQILNDNGKYFTAEIKVIKLSNIKKK
ncbi:hypothetical protein HIC20_00990, partial [Buchnera aphidicola (Hormaphis cornu)]